MIQHSLFEGFSGHFGHAHIASIRIGHLEQLHAAVVVQLGLGVVLGGTLGHVVLRTSAQSLEKGPLIAFEFVDYDDVGVSGVVLVPDLVGGLNAPELLHLPGPRGHEHEYVVGLAAVQDEAVGLVQGSDVHGYLFDLDVALAFDLEKPLHDVLGVNVAESGFHAAGQILQA